ncbi:MAG: [FeFe] hydrogenase H-cluster maturation GTPase HydF, partial [bacterium]|nr:[FeFe] hydrogenase H-cluster maturation GTPase HydF [bacterium]
NKADIIDDKDALMELIKKETKQTPLVVSAKTGENVKKLKELAVRLAPSDFGAVSITEGLCGDGDSVLLVMPQDIQAPTGRLILPQVQTIRDLLDKKCLVTCVTTDRLQKALDSFKQPPKLIITDSQVFKTVWDIKPKESMLTSFSVLFAAYKGDLPYYIEGAKAIDSLSENSRVLIAECCTHAPMDEDIGRVKLPRMLRQRFGQGLSVDVVGGTDYPEDLSPYDLVIQCGACMFNRKYVLSRIYRAKNQKIPMTNYGVAIAHLCGILDKIDTPCRR